MRGRAAQSSREELICEMVPAEQFLKCVVLWLPGILKSAFFREETMLKSAEVRRARSKYDIASLREEVPSINRRHNDNADSGNAP